MRLGEVLRCGGSRLGGSVRDLNCANRGEPARVAGHRWCRIHCASLAAAVAMASASGMAAGQTDHATIEVDATSAIGPLEPIWAYFGYDEANYTNTPEGEELLRALASIHPTPVRMRTHFLFNTGDGTPELKWGSTNVYTEGTDGNPNYDYSLIDAIMDATVGSGTLPLFQFGFMPQVLSTRPDPYENSNTYVLDGGCFYPPKDYDQWGALVTAWAEHATERYPETVHDWQWELWNEPDIAYWMGTFEEYARLYDVTEAALHSVLPEASLGGPAAAVPTKGFLELFLEHCANGTNAVTGEIGTRLDMVSFHAKGGVLITDGHVQMDLGNQMRLHQAGFQIVADSAFANTPIVLTEADPDGCAACPVSTAPHFAYRNSPAYGAYEVAMMKRSLDLAEVNGVNLKGILTWAFTFPGSPYFAGYRALSTNGIHLPVLNAFKLLAQLEGERLPVVSSAARPMSDLLNNSVRAEPDIDALSAIDGEQIRILVWHYHDDLVDAPSHQVDLQVSLPTEFGNIVALTHTRVDATHGNAYATWEAQGREESPSMVQLEELRRSMAPVIVESGKVLGVQGRRVTFSFELPRFGLSLLTLVPSPEGGGTEAGAAESGPLTDRASTTHEGGCNCAVSGRASRSLHWAALVPLLVWRRRAVRNDSFAHKRARCEFVRARSDHFMRFPLRFQLPTFSQASCLASSSHLRSRCCGQVAGSGFAAVVLWPGSSPAARLGDVHCADDARLVAPTRGGPPAERRRSELLTAGPRGARVSRLAT